MSIRFFASSTLLSAALASPGIAAYSQLDIEHVGGVMTSDGVRNVYRVYAYFTQPTDRVVSWGGTPANPTIIRTQGCGLPGGGGPFFQAPRFGGNTAPSQAQINSVPETAWDTFATIGVSIADQGSGPIGAPDQTMLTAGFPTFVQGNLLTITDAFVFTASDVAQAQAGYAGDGDPAFRVMLMQLTVAPEDWIMSCMVGKLNIVSNGARRTYTNQNWAYLEGFGVCCLPSGQCEHTWWSTCIFAYGGIMPTFACGTMCDVCDPPDCADITGDSVVNVEDLLAVINTWGPCPIPPIPCPANINIIGSSINRVDALDLLNVIEGWGPCS